VSKATERPGLADLLKEGIDAAFFEDKVMLEGQRIRMQEKPDFKTFDIAADAGPGKMLWVLDKLIREERMQEEALIASSL
jgi:vanillate O-demethylase monooxygenase subunit